MNTLFSPHRLDSFANCESKENVIVPRFCNPALSFKMAVSWERRNFLEDTISNGDIAYYNLGLDKMAMIRKIVVSTTEFGNLTIHQLQLSQDVFMTYIAINEMNKYLERKTGLKDVEQTIKRVGVGKEQLVALPVCEFSSDIRIQPNSTAKAYLTASGFFANVSPWSNLSIYSIDFKPLDSVELNLTGEPFLSFWSTRSPEDPEQLDWHFATFAYNFGGRKIFFKHG